MWATFLSSLAGIVAGGGITFFVSRYYFRRASNQLEEEASQLRELVTVLALYMQKDGLLKDVELDEYGNLKGYTQTIHAPLISSEAEVFKPSAFTQDAPSSDESSFKKQLKSDNEENQQ